jgi:hypothetical protein
MELSMNEELSTDTTTEADRTIARSRDGDSSSIPIGVGQRVRLEFTNAEGDTPSMNLYFTSLTAGAVPTISE